MSKLFLTGLLISCSYLSVESKVEKNTESSVSVVNNDNYEESVEVVEPIKNFEFAQKKQTKLRMALNKMLVVGGYLSLVGGAIYFYVKSSIYGIIDEKGCGEKVQKIIEFISKIEHLNHNDSLSLKLNKVFEKKMKGFSRDAIALRHWFVGFKKVSSRFWDIVYKHAGPLETCPEKIKRCVLLALHPDKHQGASNKEIELMNEERNIFNEGFENGLLSKSKFSYFFKFMFEEVKKEARDNPFRMFRLCELMDLIIDEVNAMPDVTPEVVPDVTPEVVPGANITNIEDID